MKITEEDLRIYRCPRCFSHLDIEMVYGSNPEPAQQLLCLECGTEYSFRLDYPSFLDGKYLLHTGRWIRFIRSIYSRVYTPATNLMFVLCGGADSARREVLSRLDIKKGDRILETGIGAGDNLPYLYRMFEPGDYYGLDVQRQMIRLCKKNLKKWNLEARLCHADAEKLPYRNESFDCVFHLGAINLFQNKKKAIDEMIRVAKPGTKIVIADESEKANRLLRFIMGKQEKVVPPLHMVPPTMEEVKLIPIWKGYGYLIEFRKPV